MTNKQNNFTPSFSKKKEQRGINFKTLKGKDQNLNQKLVDSSNLIFPEDLNQKSVNPSDLIFHDELNVLFNNEMDKTLKCGTMPSSSKNNIKDSETEDLNDEVNNSLVGNKYSFSSLDVDDFDKILSDVDNMNKSAIPDVSSLLEEEQELNIEHTDISDETRESIFAEGYMQGSSEQQAIMEKKIKELSSVIEKLKIATITPSILSEDIQSTVSIFIKKVAKSLLSDLKENMLAEMVQVKAEEFISSLKAWKFETRIYCSTFDFNSLLEVFQRDEHNYDKSISPQLENENARSFITKKNGIIYSEDGSLFDGKFRLETSTKEDSKIEAMMDINNHIDSIENMIKEVY